MKTRDMLILGALGLGGLILLRGLEGKEPKGTISPIAYRGTELQSGATGVVLRGVGVQPGWLGIPPSGAAGMRYYGKGASDAMLKFLGYTI